MQHELTNLGKSLLASLALCLGTLAAINYAQTAGKAPAEISILSEHKLIPLATAPVTLAGQAPAHQHLWHIDAPNVSYAIEANTCTLSDIPPGTYTLTYAAVEYIGGKFRPTDTQKRLIQIVAAIPEAGQTAAANVPSPAPARAPVISPPTFKR